MTAFVVASLLVIAIPGPNLIYIFTRSVDQGRRAGVVSAAGVETGTLVHVTVAALGLSSLIAASTTVFTTLTYAGALYLAQLGIRALRNPAPPDLAVRAPRVPLGRVYRDGVLVNLLNPKVVLFFLAFLPQFVPSDAGPAAARARMLGLGAVFLALGFAIDLIWALTGDALSGHLRRHPTALRRQHQVVGTVYLALAVYVLL
ncbi:hypothetical protein ACZ90_44300 [Streptomyces albus subsp. albus]|nr:hypothetical protein ACZ90_44300 [Streptomyces albus subsp. albus]